MQTSKPFHCVTPLLKYNELLRFTVQAGNKWVSFCFYMINWRTLFTEIDWNKSFSTAKRTNGLKLFNYTVSPEMWCNPSCTGDDLSKGLLFTGKLQWLGWLQFQVRFNDMVWSFKHEYFCFKELWYWKTLENYTQNSTSLFYINQGTRNCFCCNYLTNLQYSNF